MEGQSRDMVLVMQDMWSGLGSTVTELVGPDRWLFSLRHSLTDELAASMAVGCKEEFGCLASFRPLDTSPGVGQSTVG